MNDINMNFAMEKNELLPKIKDIQEAHKRIGSNIHKTPVLTSSSLNKMTGCDLYFKCENFQKVGAFKFRGASNAILSLQSDQLQKGVCTHSSGNHAAALALAATNLGVKSYIVMPYNAPEIKIKAVAGYGAEIIHCEATLDSREHTLKKVQEKTGATFIHPFDNFYVIAGQGTATLEILEEIQALDIIIAPVGGGGLLSGTAIAAKSLNPFIKVFGAEPKNANDAATSFKTKILHTALPPNTIADGLLTSLSPRTFKAISEYVDHIIEVSENEIIASMKHIWERMKIIIEPSSAVPLAAIFAQPDLFIGKKICIIISGGNVDLKNLPF